MSCLGVVGFVFGVFLCLFIAVGFVLVVGGSCWLLIVIVSATPVFLFSLLVLGRSWIKDYCVLFTGFLLFFVVLTLQQLLG